MKSLKVLAIGLLAMFSFSAVNAQVTHHKKVYHKHHHKMHRHAKKHLCPVAGR
ncbi:hypothetical protein [Mucilaginibacter sp. OK098]|uniref:hypothetical protein n=1 Tax=Mucilaginibacter sp. OK098 TaxID=1855297 RepID=UPI00090F7EA0|nr:hypothetical protein [Mucilaginibacter sp. OK098]SHN31955.1 hypothetical protein SAMN05216524_109241 [Mucilaginibacter sp. OK098]